ncbi:MAG: hypothetical protein H6625_10550 [Bdellovibrionaceae bacterium]|nr:hypothetical protein [Pseudobdellovibrionaceae bacterium]
MKLNNSILILVILFSFNVKADITSAKFPAKFKSLEGNMATVQMSSGKTIVIPKSSMIPQKNLTSQQAVMVYLSRKDLDLLFKKK